jgi:flagellar hook protein FlgE
MLKSLSSGVSGLQAHQIAMDVESNNIANVNTVGFKYSRANFSNLLSQVNQIATAPQGSLGGKNATGVGLGTTVSSMTRIDSQGSVENTDKNTDCAIQGNGFFVVSADNGTTESFTRAGDFSFDASGNFVDNNGYIVQGWTRNATTGKVDSSAPIGNISIPPGLTTPAQATTNISLKANLDSGSGDKLFTPISALDSAHGSYVDSSGTTHINSETSNLMILDAKGTRVEHAQNMGVMADATGTSLLLQNGQGESIGFQSAQIAGAAPKTTAGDVIASGDITINGVAIPALSSALTGNAVTDGNLIATAINSQQTATGVIATVNSGTGAITLTNDNSGTHKNITLALAGNGGESGLTAGSDQPMKNFVYTDGSVNQVGWSGGTYYFTTSEDLRNGMQQLAQDYKTPGAATLNPNATVTVDATGKFQVANPSAAGTDMSVTISPIVNATTLKNTTFDNVMAALNGSLPAGSSTTRSSQSLNVPTLSSSIDVYDSLGSKHTVQVNFVKSSFNPTSGSTWDVTVTVPPPATLNASPAGTFGQPSNMVEGSVTFNPDGSLQNVSGTISSLTLSPNNGAKPNQPINLQMGTINGFDGVTSFDSASATSGISQDGFTGGDLVGIRIDQSGTLVGSFSNGRSFGLAQIAMATFANDGGLSTNSGNLFSQSANSGDPIYGTASTGGRGSIQSSALEGSNVDLSRSLTELIVIQRGYQANSKTITTSDQLLQTLIGLKQ